MIQINETVDFCGVLAGVGRNDYDGKFYSSNYNETSLTKAQERDRVLHFVLDSFIHERRIKILTLPGWRWKFENLLLSEREKTQFVSLEKSTSIYARSRRHIPGRRTIYADLNDRSIEFGNGEIIYSRVCTKYPVGTSHKSIKANRLLRMSSDVYATIPITDYNATIKQKNAFFDRFYYRNAIWLDFTSQICKSVEDTIKNIHFCLESNQFEKPVVITIMNCRDIFHSPEDRVQHLLDLQPLLSVKEYWTYAGKGGVSMLTVCCTAI